MIDIKNLSEEQKQMLLAYLQNEYKNDPDRFDFPPEQMMRQAEEGIQKLVVKRPRTSQDDED